MKKRIKYTDEPIGKIRIIDNFLPPPEKLVFKNKTVKVTMELSKPSVDYFKRMAHKYHVPYQRMIRNVIDAYAAHFSVP